VRKATPTSLAGLFCKNRSQGEGKGWKGGGNEGYGSGNGLAVGKKDLDARHGSRDEVGEKDRKIVASASK